jgi:hypothetical protein
MTNTLRRFRFLSPNNDGGGGDGSNNGGNNSGNNPNPQDPPDPNNGTNNNGGNTGGNNPNPPTFDATQQEWVNRQLGSVRQEGRNTAQSELFRIAGVENINQFRTFVTNARQATTQHETALNDLQGQLDTANTNHETQMGSARTMMVRFALRSAAVEQGLNPDKLVELVEKVGGLDRFKVDLEKGEIEGLADAIKAVTELVPKGTNKGGNRFLPQNPGSGNNNGNNQDEESQQALDMVMKPYKTPKKAS